MAGAFGFVREFLMPKRPDLMTDETVGSFIERRMDKRLANNLISAVFHGIYAGDIWKLSARTLLGTAWQLEGMYGSALSGYLKLQSEQEQPAQPMMVAHPYDIAAAKEMNAEFMINDDFAKKLQSASTYTFKEGLQQLITTLQEVVEKTGNVDVKVNSPVQSTKPLESGKAGVQVSTGVRPFPLLPTKFHSLTKPQHDDNLTTENYDLVISSLRNTSLTPYVTVQTINLYYSTPNLHPYQGFGYLIPQSVPFEENPERALGVIFDSYTTKGQDSVDGTKLTIMLGGHWWDSWTSYPTSDEGLEMAKSVVARHLGITDEPAAYFVNLSKDCIPQYTVGYEDRLKDFKEGIGREFKGRLRVVGNQFNGVGVNDVVTGAWNMARGLRGEGWKSGSVGLDKVGDPSAWRRVPVREMAYRTKEQQ
jgi:oxygen-dependent protoporphyrinogen oxidase